jgi:hypothetical protein
MWDQLPQRALAFRSRVERLSAALLNKHESEIGVEGVGVFHMPSTQEVLCVGKLVGELDKLDDQHHVFLEGVSPENDTIHRIKVDLMRMKSFNVFAGQVVAMRASNPTGASLQVSKLWTDASYPIATTIDEHVYEDGESKKTKWLFSVVSLKCCGYCRPCETYYCCWSLLHASEFGLPTPR